MYIVFLTNINNKLTRCRLCFVSVSRSTLTRNLTVCNLPKLFPFKDNSLLQLKTMSLLANNLFEGNLDRFNGITVDSLVENCKLEEFPTKLTESLQSWLKAKKRGIWFKVALEHSGWVPILTQNGFNFHHAKAGFVMMYKWLADEYDNVPVYAHTMIGVGAVVVNDKGEVLLVKDKYLMHNQWKLPGGYVDPGENLVDAAIREVYEETNIRTEFSAMLNLRHAHNGMFGSSDIYFVVVLKPLSSEIKISEREIKEATWLDIHEFLSDPKILEFNRFHLLHYLEYKANNVRIDVKHGIHQILKKPYTIYYVTDKDSCQ